MAIKLKNNKFIYFLCLIILISSLFAQTIIIPELVRGYVYRKTSFIESIEFKSNLFDFYGTLMDSYSKYGAGENSDRFKEISKTDIQNRLKVHEDEYNSIKVQLDQIKENEKRDANKDVNNGVINDVISDVTNDGVNKITTGEGTFYSIPELGDFKTYDEGLTLFNNKIPKPTEEDAKKELLSEKKSSYQSLEKVFDIYKNFQYVIYNGENDEILKTNLEKEFSNSEEIKNLQKDARFYVLFDGVKAGNILENITGTINGNYFSDYDSRSYDAVKSEKIKLLIMLPQKLYYQDNIKQAEDRFLYGQNNFMKFAISEGVAVVLLLLSLVYVIKHRRNLIDNFVVRAYKEMWLEMKLVLNIFIAYLLNFFTSLVFNFYGAEEKIVLSIYFIMCTYILLRKRVKLIGIKGVIKESSVLYRLFNQVKKVFLVKSIGIKVSIFVLLTLVFIFALFLIPISRSLTLSIIIILVYIIPYLALVGYYGMKFTVGFSKIVKGSEMICSGDLNYQIDEKQIGTLGTLAKNINSIKSGLEKSIKNETKSERMKTELITNVSHDLKTPLTSIINYVDLIKKGNLSSEDIQDYIKIIDRKSQRLKTLIEDLFEASRAASGEIDLNMERLDIVALLKQSLAEFEERIKDCSLDFRVNAPSEKIYVMVDGKRTWRVFENQIINILKYSLDNTRVYINVEKHEDEVVIVMKNISAFEIDFNNEEITERFKRGDKSRNTEGSGLGLAISKGLTELQGGEFNVEVDGDLFKTIMKFPIVG
ncbi:sensor histidine kinase [Clostridium sp. 'White wine YQ']|uniref:sensor histidine kinase n=1 Tax=Clostridium sp. 'White wine YQ' TaxID=3027474 RepID=UPI00236596D0|nr:HAMP domain-containing sensor histidine kinase [Clostridium sp. 'White wine YQ']MDD7794944.1 HAMP domain-containing sensor histidine kinase [Clostridium sp. 'White wine YQ']